MKALNYRQKVVKILGETFGDFIVALNRLFHRPVTRKDVLLLTKRNKDCFTGLCIAITDSLRRYGIPVECCKDITKQVTEYFPKFSYEIAKLHGASGEPHGYWWELREWNSGRGAYLDWLIKEYENDTTNLRKLKKE